MCCRKLLKDFRELYGYGSMGMCSSSDDKITGPEAGPGREKGSQSRGSQWVSNDYMKIS